MLNGIELVKSRGNDVKYISSLEVSEMVGRAHKNVLQDLDKIANQLVELKIQPIEYFENDTYLDSLNRVKRCYKLNKKGCELYATRMSGIEGTSFAIKYIERFNEMESQLQPKLPGSYAEALLELAHTVQQKEEMEKKMALDAPKVILAESIENSSSLILVGELAKILKQNGVEIGQNRLFERLRDMGYLVKSGASRNLPTQRSMDLELFRITEGTRTGSEGTKITKTTKVTGKGQSYFVNKFLKEVK